MGGFFSVGNLLLWLYVLLCVFKFKKCALPKYKAKKKMDKKKHLKHLKSGSSKLLQHDATSEKGNGWAKAFSIFKHHTRFFQFIHNSCSTQYLLDALQNYKKLHIKIYRDELHKKSTFAISQFDSIATLNKLNLQQRKMKLKMPFDGRVIKIRTCLWMRAPKIQQIEFKWSLVILTIN